MSRKLQLLVSFIALTVLAAGLLAARIANRIPSPPLEISLWYWHAPFRITKPDRIVLDQIGVKQLFVRAGTFRKLGTNARLTLPQQWMEAPGSLQVHLVFNFGYDLVRKFEFLDNRDLAADVAMTIAAQRLRAEKAGVKVAGIQLDFDVPTRLLPKYSDLLRQIRGSLQEGAPRNSPGRRRLLSWSITVLPTWLSSRGLTVLASQVDFIVPQFYEAVTPTSLDKLTPISSQKRFEKGLAAANRLGVPFYAGAPAYGHALAFDSHGKLMGMFHDLSAREAARSPDFAYKRAWPADAQGQSASTSSYAGEDLVEFSTASSAGDRGAGARVIYDLPSPELVARHWRLLAEKRPANCRGIILFRYPEPRESQTLSLESLQAALHGIKSSPGLDLKFETASAPWDLIDTGHAASRAPIELTVKATNVGNSATFVRPDAVTLTLEFDRPGLEDVDPGGFDSYTTQQTGGLQQNSTGSSLARSNAVTFRLVQLCQGEFARAGPISLGANGPTTVTATWTAIGPGGFETARGFVGPIRLNTSGTSRGAPDEVGAPPDVHFRAH